MLSFRYLLIFFVFFFPYLVDLTHRSLAFVMSSRCHRFALSLSLSVSGFLCKFQNLSLAPFLMYPASPNASFLTACTQHTVAKGRTNIELREQFILADGVSQTMTAFRSKPSPTSTLQRTPISSANAGPITKVRKASHCRAKAWYATRHVQYSFSPIFFFNFSAVSLYKLLNTLSWNFHTE